MKPINELEGRELDAAVAEEVMGLEVRHDEDRGYFIFGPSPWAWKLRSTDEDRGGDAQWLPGLHEDIAAAWLVIGKLREAGITGQIQLADRCVAFWPVDAPYAYYPTENAVTAIAETAPEAICRAALAAVRVKNPPESLA